MCVCGGGGGDFDEVLSTNTELYADGMYLVLMHITVKTLNITTI